MYVCMYLRVFCIALVRKNGPGRFPELKLTINQSIINPGKSVWFPDQGTGGKVIEKSGPRSYTVQTPDGQYHRNRHHIISLPIESDSGQNPPTTSSDVLLDVPIQPSSTNKSVSTQPITNGIRLKSGRISNQQIFKL